MLSSTDQRAIARVLLSTMAERIGRVARPGELDARDESEVLSGDSLQITLPRIEVERVCRLGLPLLWGMWVERDAVVGQRNLEAV